MSCGEIVGVIANAITAGAAVCGACLAYRGLHLWRVEMRGRAEHETAVRMLKNMYRFIAALQATRRELLFSREIKDLDQIRVEAKGAKETDLKSPSVIKWDVFQNSWWVRVDEIGSELERDFFEARALWGGGGPAQGSKKIIARL